MEKANRKKFAEEWNTILENYPYFARTFLAQQAILIETSELGLRIADRSMNRILETG